MCEASASSRQQGSCHMCICNSVKNNNSGAIEAVVKTTRATAGFWLHAEAPLEDTLPLVSTERKKKGKKKCCSFNITSYYVEPASLWLQLRVTLQHTSAGVIVAFQVSLRACAPPAPPPTDMWRSEQVLPLMMKARRPWDFIGLQPCWIRKRAALYFLSAPTRCSLTHCSSNCCCSFMWERDTETCAASDLISLCSSYSPISRMLA